MKSKVRVKSKEAISSSDLLKNLVRPKKPISPPEWLNNPEVIVFATERESAAKSTFHFLHVQDSLSQLADALFGRSKKEVREDWEKVVGQMRFLLHEVSGPTKEYELSELTFQLGFSAEGHIVFVAKGGVTTTISAKFTRIKDKSQSPSQI